jgi:hypothetical protein
MVKSLQCRGTRIAAGGVAMMVILPIVYSKAVYGLIEMLVRKLTEGNHETVSKNLLQLRRPDSETPRCFANTILTALLPIRRQSLRHVLLALSRLITRYARVAYVYVYVCTVRRRCARE